MDWRDALNSVKESLPEGENVVAEPVDEASSARKCRLDILLEKKGRAGKTATIISGFSNETDDEISAIAARLKSSLGTGGSARGGEILIQGDRRSDVQRLLSGLGYKTRLI